MFKVVGPDGAHLFDAGWPYLKKSVRIGDVNVSFVEHPFTHAHNWVVPRDLTPDERAALHAEIAAQKRDMGEIAK